MAWPARCVMQKFSTSILLNDMEVCATSDNDGRTAMRGRSYARARTGRGVTINACEGEEVDARRSGDDYRQCVRRPAGGGCARVRRLDASTDIKKTGTV